MGLDVGAAHVDVVAHEDRADVVRNRRLLHSHLQEGPQAGVDRRVPELGEVHFSQTLQALELLRVIRMLCDEPCLFDVVLQVHLRVAHQGGVKGWLGYVTRDLPR